jgi:SAM-dependent methyltransferase
MSATDAAAGLDQRTLFERRTREKWRELPATRSGRVFSADLLEWPDDKLLEYWEECRRQIVAPAAHGWFLEQYATKLGGLDVLEVGPGIGIDGIHFAQHGARMTFADIVEDNLALLRRICALKGVEADTHFIEDFLRFDFDRAFDAFLFIGSMHHAPFEFAQREVAALAPFLKPGGRVVMLAYPKERYIATGARDFEEFAARTDGARTPWAEWYDEMKVGQLFGPAFRLNWSRRFGQQDIEFIWFDLAKVGGA